MTGTRLASLIIEPNIIRDYRRFLRVAKESIKMYTVWPFRVQLTNFKFGVGIKTSCLDTHCSYQKHMIIEHAANKP